MHRKVEQSSRTLFQCVSALHSLRSSGHEKSAESFEHCRFYRNTAAPYYGPRRVVRATFRQYRTPKPKAFVHLSLFLWPFRDVHTIPRSGRRRTVDHAQEERDVGAEKGQRGQQGRSSGQGHCRASPPPRG